MGQHAHTSDKPSTSTPPGILDYPPAGKRHDVNSQWQCPACRGLCVCPSCLSFGGSSSLSLSHARTLAAAYVYMSEYLEESMERAPTLAQAHAAAAAVGLANAATYAVATSPTIRPINANQQQQKHQEDRQQHDKQDAQHNLCHLPPSMMGLSSDDEDEVDDENVAMTDSLSQTHPAASSSHHSPSTSSTSALVSSSEGISSILVASRSPHLRPSMPPTDNQSNTSLTLLSADSNIHASQSISIQHANANGNGGALATHTKTNTTTGSLNERDHHHIGDKTSMNGTLSSHRPSTAATNSPMTVTAKEEAQTTAGTSPAASQTHSTSTLIAKASQNQTGIVDQHQANGNGNGNGTGGMNMKSGAASVVTPSVVINRGGGKGKGKGKVKPMHRSHHQHHEHDASTHALTTMSTTTTTSGSATLNALDMVDVDHEMDEEDDEDEDDDQSHEHEHEHEEQVHEDMMVPHAHTTLIV